MTNESLDSKALENAEIYPPEPDRWCDLVMKGGVTSAIVYPLAFCEIARGFRLRNIGGTSAGAIAAAGAAAAESQRRRTGSGAGFAKASTLPAWVAMRGHVLSLFKPQKPTAPIFDIFTTMTDIAHGGKLKALLKAVLGFKFWAAIGALPGLAAIILAARLGLFEDLASTLDRVAAAVVGLALIVTVLAGIVVGVAYGLLRRVLRAIPDNFYGLTTGFGEADNNGVPSLTVWLTDYLDELAGLPTHGQPLTFGDLWGLDRKLRATDPRQYDELAETMRLRRGERAVNLEMMTTCITLGRPYRFPHLPHTFFFSPAQFVQLFPKRVVDWMVAHPADVREELKPILERDGYVPLPDAADLPVIVAMRMSISTPPLVSAIPLGSFDFHLPAAQRRVEPVWFSDGGITSNFPVHFFDSPLPRWPTFAINLKPFPFGQRPSANQAENVDMADSNTGGFLESWQRIGVQEDGTYKGSLPGFFGAVLSTMQSWTDNLQSLQPGYRDRIAHVLQDSDEGGSNLRSAEMFVKPLSKRGREAGARLRRRFSPPGDGTAMTWANHRWARYRRTMASLQTYAESYAAGFNETRPGDRSYSDLLDEANSDSAEPRSYRMSLRQKEFAQEGTGEFLKLSDVWKRARVSFQGGAGVSFEPKAPRPENALRMTPPHDQTQYARNDDETPS